LIIIPRNAVYHILTEKVCWRFTSILEMISKSKVFIASCKQFRVLRFRDLT
jgi:hypothetical protein